MVSCCQCQGIDGQFDPRIARYELKRFRRRGPPRSTRILLEGLRGSSTGASLLDIGGGIGAIHHVLLDAGVREATHVDIASAYLAAARDEATRLGHGDRVQFRQGDLVQLAPTLPAADLVTLDRVICCYPDMDALVGVAAEKTRRVLGAVYPREAWWVRLGIRAMNLLSRLRRSDFRVYLHPPAAIAQVLNGRGLERTIFHRTFLWEIATYARPA